MANWPKYDPRTGFWLCENCWNRGNWSHHCHHGMCECLKPTCGGAEQAKPKVKFTKEGQLPISVDSVIEVGPKS